MNEVRAESRALVSIIVCTRDRPVDLARTLESILVCEVRPGIEGELIVVENGSFDPARRIVEGLRSEYLKVRVLHEPRKGKAYACNTALRSANGGILLFTDDDVRVPANWINGMIRPILSGEAEAVAGGVALADANLRSWMMPRHRSWLAGTERLNPERPHRFVGANMAFARHVFEVIPGFDVELGPGALGFSEETLLAYQMEKAGLRIVSAFDIVVKHHFSVDRLRREAFLDKAVRGGRGEAYIEHHWRHRRVSHPFLRKMGALMALATWRACHLRELKRKEGCAEREMLLVRRYATLTHYRKEAKRPRNYELFGLRKVRGIKDSDVFMGSGGIESGAVLQGREAGR